ncbi:MAG: dockerin type I domain-containing protein [Accumulibacter sp.]|jgi:streptogramin lyase|uniref:dockerin type I domain-containing protein n=1 Tax=Accumulibacter sp. TaxID=2053492 RepID=UPI002FC39379
MKHLGRSPRTRRYALPKLFAVSVVASFGFAPVGIAGHLTGTNALYTFTVDFAEGTFLNTTAIVPTMHQVQFNQTITPFPFVYVAVSARGTLVRIDVNTGAILGEYLTAPAGNGRDPSRTTVDQLGNAWVTNRAEAGESPPGSNQTRGSVTRVGLIIGGERVDGNGNPATTGAFLKDSPAAPIKYNTCVDRDNDGRIKTSSGLTDILPWTGGGGGADTHGGVTTADDECIINYTRVTGTHTRTVAVDSNNDVWVGGDNNAHEKLDGVSGQPMAGTQFNLGCGGYGGFMDKFGVLWSARFGNNLLRFDPNESPPPMPADACLDISHGNYGLALDPKSCHVWHTTNIDPALVGVNPNDPNFDPTLYTGEVVEMDRYGNVLNYWPHGRPFAQGVVVDGNGNAWVAHSAVGPLTGTPNFPGIVPATTVGHLKTSGILTGTFVGNVTLVDSTVTPNIVGEGPTGVAVDTNGKIWVTNYYTHNVMRIDPDLGPIGGASLRVGAVDLTVDLGPGAFPYNYSDMTGQIAIGNPTQGFWQVVHDGLALGTPWGTITWNSEPQAFVPLGASITVAARAADTQAALSGQSFITVTSGLPFNLTGRYIEVKASLKGVADAGCVETPSPILSDLRVEANVCDVDRDGDVDQLDLSAISRVRGKTPLPGDRRDANGDGKINPADVKFCIPKCTRANCATQ